MRVTPLGFCLRVIGTKNPKSLLDFHYLIWLIDLIGLVNIVWLFSIVWFDDTVGFLGIVLLGCH